MTRAQGDLGLALEEFIDEERSRGRIAAVHRCPPRAASFGPWPPILDPRLKQALEARGVQQLYSHQVEAINLALEGIATVVVTPTASGKTLCYNLPVLQTILQTPTSRALYLFPTKALAQDQLAELIDLEREMGAGLGAFVYDGDTPADARRAVRTRAQVVVTNPDMLHTGILPHHTRWAQFFGELRYVVIDEVHSYRGVFGSHVANVLRRLQRVCRFHGSKPTFILCSATIANPQEHAEGLLGLPVTPVSSSGAPAGTKTVIFYNPPIINRELGIRRSYISATKRIASFFFERGVRGIVFAASRLNVEVLTRFLKGRFERQPRDRGRIRGYRGGYLPSLRREIERDLRSGKVQGVISTNALELGIDIGSLDLAILSGYPGTIASTWQQAGRAGRRKGEAAVILVGRSDPLDQFLMHHPSYFFQASPEHARMNPDNLSIVLSHLKCACFEIPMVTDETFGSLATAELLQYLAEHGVLYEAGARFHWSDKTYPADSISLRMASPENFVVMDQDEAEKIIAEVDWSSAPSTLYEEAIYLVEGRSYQVERLDYDRRRAYVRAVDVDYFTDAITDTSVEVLDSFECLADQGAGRSFFHGEVHVAWRVSGFKKIAFESRENVGFGEVHLPDHEMHTTAFWVTFHEAFLRALPYERAEVMGGLAGLAYILQHVAPLYLMCDARDLRRWVGVQVAPNVEQQATTGNGRLQLKATVVEPEGMYEGWMRWDDDVHAKIVTNLCLGADQVKEVSPKTFEPTLFLYDSIPGGVGFSSEIYDTIAQLFKHVEHLLLECSCQEGCPSCVGPPAEVGGRAKEIALRVVRGLGALV